MNEEENKVQEPKPKKEKKPVTLKSLIIKRLIFVILFLLVAIGVTAYLVIANPFAKEEEEPEPVQEEIDNEVPTLSRNHVSLLNYDTDTFDYNELKIYEMKETFEDHEISYYQIDGLKNASIEEKINSHLKIDLENAIIEAQNNGNIRENRFNVWTYNTSSFANTLSICYTIYSYDFDDDDPNVSYQWYGYVPENYDLTTGNNLQIQDLFTDDTLGADIFNDTFYSEFVSSYASTDWDEEGWSLIVADYKDIEEEILELMMDFNDGKDIPFYFDEQTVTLAENYARIFFDEHLDFVAVYNKFKTSSSIFTGKYQALKNLPVLTKRYNSDYQVVEESENYYIDLSLDRIYNNFYDEKDKIDEAIIERLFESTKEYVDNEVKTMKKEAIDSGKFIIYNNAYHISKGGYWDYFTQRYIPDNLYVFSISEGKLETTKSLYNSEIKEIIQKIFRKAPRVSGGDVYLYDNQFRNYRFFAIEDEDEFDYDNFQESWESSNTEVYLDQDGNIYQTLEEATGFTWGIYD